eukprot:1160094-Pelagomonas_calceolata.AAC.5
MSLGSFAVERRWIATPGAAELEHSTHATSARLQTSVAWSMRAVCPAAWPPSMEQLRSAGPP